LEIRETGVSYIRPIAYKEGWGDKKENRGKNELKSVSEGGRQIKSKDKHPS